MCHEERALRIIALPPLSRPSPLPAGKPFMSNDSPAFRLHPRDNVAIARNAISKGVALPDFENVTSMADIPAAHKVALSSVSVGEPILRYGQIIGFATQPICAGEHVHTHNLAMGSFERDYAFGEDARIPSTPARAATFQGFVRPDGRVATRNYIGVVSTVNCSATVTKLVVSHFSRSGALENYPYVDGVVPITHSFGCCRYEHFPKSCYHYRSMKPVSHVPEDCQLCPRTKHG